MHRCYLTVTSIVVGFVAILVGLLLMPFPTLGVASSPIAMSLPNQSLNNTTDEFHDQRQQMVQQQLYQRGIKAPSVLNAMSEVPRHKFVPASLAHLAYADQALPLTQDQTISQPYIVAYMTEAAKLDANDKVLEIGTGSGYQAAILGKIAQEVYSVEIIPELAATARQILSELGYNNVHLKTGDGYQGWVEHAPYDAIVVTAAPAHLPQALLAQLALNGRMVIPVGTWEQEILIIKKTPSGYSQERTIPVHFVPMTTRE